MRHLISWVKSKSPAILTIAFLAYALLAAALIWYSEKVRIEHERIRVSTMAAEHVLAIQLNIEQALSSTYALATLVQLNKGEVRDFDAVATVMRSFYPGISSLQLAPGGVIQRIAPLAGNEKAIGHNLLTDPERDKEAFLTRDTGKLTLAGPFQLLQGGLGAAGRLPVYLNDDKGRSRFWGFVIVLIRFPEVLAPADLPRLEEHGYKYQVWRTHPDTGARHIIAGSSTTLVDPVERSLQIPNSTWTLSVVPVTGWIDRRAIAVKTALALFVLMLFAYTWRKSHPA
jgi:sensor domain CHASE-containing protein